MFMLDFLHVLVWGDPSYQTLDGAPEAVNVRTQMTPSSNVSERESGALRVISGVFMDQYLEDHPI